MPDQQTTQASATRQAAVPTQTTQASATRQAAVPTQTTQVSTITTPASTPALAPTPTQNEDVFSLVDQVFLLPPQTKSQLKQVFPDMNEAEKKEFLDYINSILKKQEEILSYLVANNPDFIMELKRFNRESDQKAIKQIEAKFQTQEEMDLKSLEQALTNL